MSQRTFSRLVAGCFVLAALAAAAAPPVRIEVSADGLETVELPTEPLPPTGWAKSRGAAIYPLTPVSVRVVYNRLPPPEIFVDGFESGDTSAWSTATP